LAESTRLTIYPQSSARVRLAFVGCGRATAELHLPALRDVGGIEVVAVCDTDRARSDDVGRQFDIAERYDDLAQLLSNSQVDAIAICSPPETHATNAIAALDAGKHLFVEKPLSLSVDDCDRIIMHATHASGKAVVGFNLRQHRLLRQAREIIRRGDLGRIHFVRSAFTTDLRLRRVLPGWRNRRIEGGGVIFELGSHHFDLWRWMFGAEVEEVFTRSHGVASDDAMAAISARLSGEIFAWAQFDEQAVPTNELEVSGEAGRLTVSLYDFDGLHVAPLSTPPGSTAARAARIRHTLASLPDALRGIRKGGDYVATYRAEWLDFLATVRDGAPPAATLEDGRAALRICAAAVASSLEGRPVALA
jgi:myo-inositol 2-dehydrogenase / D-chiro-inositol 1-dehydrogenase